MSTWALPADTLLSSLLPSGGGGLAAGDTVDFNGYTLIMDCDAVAYPFIPTNAGGVSCKLELRDLSRIRINASLPATVHPWVDPEHPLPVSTPGVSNGVDGYITGLTANARAEIQLAADFTLGGGTANLPTEVRKGAFWAIVSGSNSTTELVFDRDFPLHAGDYIFNLTLYNGIQKVQIAAYDPITHTATLVSSPARRTAGDTWALLAGGICIRKDVNSGTGIFSADVNAGSLTVFGSNARGSIFNKNANVKRVLASPAEFATSNSGPTTLLGRTPGSVVVANEVACNTVSGGWGNTEQTYSSCILGECVTNSFIMGSLQMNNRIFLNSGRSVRDNSVSPAGVFHIELRNTFMAGSITINPRSSLHLVNSTYLNTRNTDTTIISTGSVSRTARTNFPVDTDLPDAQYHAPNVSDVVTWRYEDRWVRKGETLRLQTRWMPAGASSKASVAVTDPAAWWPDLWPLHADAFASIEFTPGIEQLKWHGKSLTWNNDTGEDRQVRIWECVTGDTLGGYLRTWQATGGAM